MKIKLSDNVIVSIKGEFDYHHGCCDIDCNNKDVWCSDCNLTKMKLSGELFSKEEIKDLLIDD